MLTVAWFDVAAASLFGVSTFDVGAVVAVGSDAIIIVVVVAVGAIVVGGGGSAAAYLGGVVGVGFARCLAGLVNG